MPTQPRFEPGYCTFQIERETRWYPGAYCNQPTHPFDEYCDEHGGRDVDDDIDGDDLADFAEGNLPSNWTGEVAV